MTISVGDRLPQATFLTLGPDGPEEVTAERFFGAGRAVLIGMPGAFTGTCSSAHLPSVVAAMEQIRARGVDRVAVVTVNDPFVLDAWSRAHGAAEAGVTMLADADAAFTRAMGLVFSAPQRGLIDRSVRYAAIIDDGVVTELDVEQGRGTCDMTGGAAILAKL
ncbi:redoxin family protein [Rhodobacteraceae bacterium 2CG4]|uniref:Glutathione-dependent peroxiredoxin n=1 Tax=Halovulum marinum TaxID=2662447 RepID=A0A6L5Z6G2_9RHOB|nr:peroxiredoxin [Halovulum marinum]MSU91949.1 redoxin family protein [Halovulum marinum]